MIATGDRARVVRAIAAFSVWCLASAMPSQAQVIEDQDAPGSRVARDDGNRAELDARARALKKWIDEFARWKRLRDAKDAAARRRPLPPMPDPPEWLSEDCRNIVVDAKGLWADACRVLTEWKDDPLTAQLRREIAESRTQREAPTRTMWWQRLHVDTLWPMTQWGSSVYGIVGTHATVEVRGRFQVFIAPGAMLLNVPGERGSRDWKVATDWGVAYRLFDFRLPGSRRHAQLHMNLVTAWVFSGPDSLVPNRISLAGFSFTFKQPPRRP